MTHPIRFGAFVPQGWKLEFAGWEPQRAWARAKEVALAAELAGLIDPDTSPDAYFAALIDPSSASVNMPEMARQWVEEDDTMQRALALVADLEAQAQEIVESREIVGEIDAADLGADRHGHRLGGDRHEVEATAPPASIASSGSSR